MERQLSLPSFQTGIAMRFNTPKIVGFSTGIYVERKGFRIPVEMPVSDAQTLTYYYCTHYNYVTIPLMLNATVGHKAQFFVQAGGFVSVLFRIHVFCEELDFDGTNPGGYQYVDAGFAGGVGLKVPVKERLILSLEARNTTGFRQIIKNTESKDAINNTNTTFLIGIGYAFRQWKK
ncbi:MAG: outer membrane beta-barrel protein [Chitinophagales bacterium]|nr:outer membrane beta-barrel protein [Chitinophagales bacterium]